MLAGGILPPPVQEGTEAHTQQNMCSRDAKKRHAKCFLPSHSPHAALKIPYYAFPSSPFLFFSTFPFHSIVVGREGEKVRKTQNSTKRSSRLSHAFFHFIPPHLPIHAAFTHSSYFHFPVPRQLSKYQREGNAGSTPQERRR